MLLQQKHETTLKRVQKTCFTKTFVARLRFCNWFCELVHSDGVDQLPTYFTDEITLNGDGNAQNNKHRSAEYPKLTHDARYMTLSWGTLCCQ